MKLRTRIAAMAVAMTVFALPGCSGASTTGATTEAQTFVLADEPLTEAIPTTTDDGKAKLLFEDNFDGDKLDLSKWERCPEWERQGGAYWSDDQSYLDGEGHLTLNMIPSDQQEGYIDSGAIRTKGMFERAFGYFEASIQFPVCDGTWGAFWLMGETVSNVDGSGRDGTEIDIIESIFNRQNKANSALHWDGYGDEHQSESETYLRPGIYDDQYHLFALEWTPEEYVFYIDGVEKWRTTAGGVCQNPLYLKLSVEAAPWAGKVNMSRLPMAMMVDYVKVYDKNPYA